MYIYIYILEPKHDRAGTQFPQTKLVRQTCNKRKYHGGPNSMFMFTVQEAAREADGCFIKDALVASGTII